MSKVVLTDGQRARIQAQLEEWGDHPSVGMRGMFVDCITSFGYSKEEAAQAVDRELAWRYAWLKKARRTPEDKPVIVTPDEVDKILEVM